MSDEKPKLLVLTSGYPQYSGDMKGGGSFVYLLTAKLCKYFEAIVLTPYMKDNKKEEMIDGVRVRRFKYFFNRFSNLAGDEGILPKLKENKLYFLIVPFFLISQFITTARVIKRFRINTIHAHWILPQGIIIVLYRLLFRAKVKILLTVHGADILSFDNIIGKTIKKMVLRNVDHITVVSDYIKSEVLKYVEDNGQIHISPMGIDTQIFNPNKADESVKTELGVQSSFLLFVGYISERKGLEYLIRALPEIIKLDPVLKLVVIGDGTLLPSMKELAKDLDVLKNIIFLGLLPNNELPRYLASCDIFIGPSLSEGFGLVFAEAASSGCHVITSDFPAMKDIIKDNETGFIVPMRDSDSIADKVMHILNNKEDLKSMTSKARKHIVNNFDWEIVGEKYAKLLLNLN